MLATPDASAGEPRVIRSWLNVLVAAKKQEATDIFSFDLVDLERRELPPFSAGSHIDVQVAPTLVRQYSLCNSPHERARYQIAVLRDPASRGGSSGMVEDVQQGQQIRISEPRNHFSLDATAERHLLLAGGIGVTPLLCMAERLANIDAPFFFHYLARSRSRTAFYERIAASSFAEKVGFHFDDEPESRLDLDEVLREERGTHLYVCGPTGFMDWVLSSARSRGWPEARLHREYFTASPQVGANSSFRVRLASSGREFDVPAERSIVAVLANAGIEIPVSCEQGVCGTCLTRVLDGIPDHRDLFLTEEERRVNDQCLPCCSRSLSPILVIDL
jgi:vanillate O-demethylase ferredoxin subunit